MFFKFIISWMIVKNINGLSSPITPYMNYTFSIELLANTVDLWWTVNETNETILFELHINTTGWIALGISPGKISLSIISDFCIIVLGIFSWWYKWF
jgi:hypothetical protein